MVTVSNSRLLMLWSALPSSQPNPAPGACPAPLTSSRALMQPERPVHLRRIWRWMRSTYCWSFSLAAKPSWKPLVQPSNIAIEPWVGSAT